MNYSVKSGDCLWNIVKENYGLKSNTDIAKKVDKIAKKNDIKNANSIFEGQKIELYGLDDDGNKISKKKKENNATDAASDKQKDLAQKFDDWTNTEPEYYEDKDGNYHLKDVDDFKMFDFNAGTYSKDVKDFAQKYIDKFDENKDGVWNKEEFKKMSGITDDDLADTAYGSIRFDDNKDNITAEEFATSLIVSDIDFDQYDKNGGVIDSTTLDGKVNFNTYSSLGDKDGVNFETYSSIQEAIYDNFYNQE